MYTKVEEGVGGGIRDTIEERREKGRVRERIIRGLDGERGGE